MNTQLTKFFKGALATILGAFTIKMILSPLGWVLMVWTLLLIMTAKCFHDFQNNDQTRGNE